MRFRQDPGPEHGRKCRAVLCAADEDKMGSCNPGSCSIRLNTDLAKKPREFLEYIVVHEMTHLLVRHHDERFGALMDKHLPNWRQLRQSLNNSPLAHTDWAY
jgi:predicted metal-dependent hydrolase